MYHLALATALLGSVGSITANAELIVKYHDKLKPVSVSELAAAQDNLLRRFRVGLFICGSLFAISMYGYVVQRIDNALAIFVVYTISYVSILMAALLPARESTYKFHVKAGQIMGLSMLALAWLFAANIDGAYGSIELFLSVVMTVLAAVTYLDRKRFAYYELSHCLLNRVGETYCYYRAAHIQQLIFWFVGT
jgi:hypothetical protein